MKKKVTIIIILIGGVLMFMLFFNEKKVKYDEVLLYESNEGAIDVNFEENQPIAGDFLPGYLKISDDKYITYKDSGSGEYSIVNYENGKEIRTVLVNEIHSQLRYNSATNSVFYLDDGNVKKMDVISGNVTDITSVSYGENDSFYVSSDEQYVFFIDKGIENKLLRKNISTEELYVIDEDVLIFDASTNGKIIYQKTASQKFGIYLYDDMNKRIEKIFADSERSNDIAISIDGKQFLYTRHKSYWFYDNGKDCLHCYNLSTKKDAVIYETKSNSQIDYLSFLDY
ncbi:hypothetical protein SAMN05660668_02823 [Pseudobutyrivibrio sp. AR14]|uniref:hypothetical protein n=1 Tax=Pseudobutyrivibrio sp. AR14 TaxID=1520804 RepID=UPI000891F87E|nr:hypothetical protein [Pseudobutyrivibrio sp. AR14]SCY49162.1 hypothetical protein SAMN05660668_02823 [Pseudobutyrivibrio sp. AR14]